MVEDGNSANHCREILLDDASWSDVEERKLLQKNRELCSAKSLGQYTSHGDQVDRRPDEAWLWVHHDGKHHVRPFQRRQQVCRRAYIKSNHYAEG